MKKIDLGCGKNKKEGYTGIDKFNLEGVDIVMNLEREKLPFADNSVDEINASHLLEHINNIFFVLNECWRVLKPHGKMTIEVPYFRSFWSDVALDHKRKFGVWSWYSLRSENPEKYFCKAVFKVNKLKLFWVGKKHVLFFLFEIIINRMQKVYESIFSHLLPVDFMSVELEAVKC